MTNCVRCRDCKFWMISDEDSKKLENYPRDNNIEFGWVFGRCSRILNYIFPKKESNQGYIPVGLSSQISVMETDANFGCVAGEVNEN